MVTADKKNDEESITRAINSFVSPKGEKFLPSECPAIGWGNDN